MTSTSFNVGLTDNTRLSSRVLRPPGGGHTDIFGGEPEPPRGRRPAPSSIIPGPQEPVKTTNGPEATQNGQATEAQPEQQAQPEPAETSKPESPKESPNKPEVPIENPNKPEAPKESPKLETQPEPPKVEPPRRVRVPPGGFSSGLW